MERLADKKCVPCDDPSIPRMSREEAERLRAEISGWSLEEVKEHLLIVKQFQFKDFRESMKFVNKVAEIAEEENHHPNIFIMYNKVKLGIYTHMIRGLHENDFILADKIDLMHSQGV
jgi:4a-hydroxytetrahydrobiopterin dehydratase